MDFAVAARIKLAKSGSVNIVEEHNNKSPSQVFDQIQRLPPDRDRGNSMPAQIQCKITLTSFEDQIQIQPQSDPRELNDCKIQAKTVSQNLEPDSISYNTKPTSLDVSGELTQMQTNLVPGKMGWNWEGQG